MKLKFVCTLIPRDSGNGKRPYTIIHMNIRVPSMMPLSKDEEVYLKNQLYQAVKEALLLGLWNKPHIQLEARTDVSDQGELPL
jgi:hypothetical protein